MRPYRIIQGICYPHLVSGSNTTKRVTASLSDPEAYYYDESIKLSEEDLNSFKDKPICYEHDQSHVIGEIAQVWKDSDGKMRMQGRIYTDTPEGEEMFHSINTKNTSGLSVGYSAQINKFKNVERKNCYEISVCKQGFFDGAAVSVTASEKKNYITNPSKNILNFKMATETNIATLDTNKDASELAKIHDDLLKKTEEQAKELAKMKAMEEQLALLQAEKQQQLQKYAESQRPKLKEVLELTEQQFKEQNGPDAVLPAEYRQSVENAFIHPAGEEAAAVITASAFSWKKARDARLAMEEKMKELENKNRQLLSDHEVAMTHVKASERMHLATETTKEVPIAASSNSKPLNMSNLFVPSDSERQLYRESYGKDLPAGGTVNVNASTLNIPTHPFKKFVPNSLSNIPGGNVNYSWLFNNEAKFAGVPVKMAVVDKDKSDF